MKHEMIRLPSNRSFGLLFFIVFLIISLWPLKDDGEIRIVTFTISLFFLILGLLNSKILKPLNFLWIKFGLMLGKFINPIIMAIIFYTTVVPIGLIFKILRKDLLSIKKNPNLKSYWVKKTHNKNSMKNQF